MKILGIGENGRQPGSESQSTHIELAACVILLHIGSENPEVEAEGGYPIIGTILVTFPLPDHYLEELIEMASSESPLDLDPAVFKGQINKTYSHEEKVAVVEAAWMIIYGDESMARDDEYFAKKLVEYIWLDEEDHRIARKRAKGKKT